MKPSNALRQKILNSEQSRYAIAKSTGLQQATLSRFVNGRTGISSDAVDSLAEYFGLELRPVRKTRKA
jgi:plasmid maintenance system antidote protein VapI